MRACKGGTESDPNFKHCSGNEQEHKGFGQSVQQHTHTPSGKQEQGASAQTPSPTVDCAWRLLRRLEEFQPGRVPAVSAESGACSHSTHRSVRCACGTLSAVWPPAVSAFWWMTWTRLASASSGCLSLSRRSTPLRPSHTRAHNCPAAHSLDSLRTSLDFAAETQRGTHERARLHPRPGRLLSALDTHTHTRAAAHTAAHTWHHSNME